MAQEYLTLLKEEVKKQLPEILENAAWLWAHPETGYKEIETQKYCLSVLEKHGFTCKTYPDVTGFICELDTGKPGPTVAIMGEMDSVICFGHPDANPVTGAAHSCGHSVQMTTSLGAFTVLAQSGVLKDLTGKILLIAVPAEECLEAEWRLEEIQKGRLRYLGGKPELMYRGAFDGVDVVINMHMGTLNDKTFRPMGHHNGFISKTVEFQGRAAHAAAAPYEGNNALYMVNTALVALNGVRETFRDADMVRVHGIITNGGAISNAIPEKTGFEAHCRANNIDAELDAAMKFDRAMGAGAYAFGGKAVIKTQPGYMPYIPTMEFNDITIDVANEVFGEGRGLPGPDVAGCEDMGDLNTVIPVVQLQVNYGQGSLHGADFFVADQDVYEDTSLYMAALTYRLLENNGALVEKVKRAHKPLFATMEEYCAFVDPLFSQIVLP